MELVSPSGAGVELGAVFRALQESIVYGLLAAIIGALAFVAYFSSQGPQFRTQTSVMVSSPSRNEATVEQLAVQARAFGEIVNDDAIQNNIESATGIPVNQVGSPPNVKVTAQEDMPGVLNISTEADSPEASKALSEAVVEEIRGRAQTVRDQALGDFEQAYQGLIGDLEQKRQAALSQDPPAADISRYDTALNELRAAQQQPRLNHLTVSLLSQETDSPDTVERRPMMMGIVLGLVVGLIVFAVVAAVKFFFPRSINHVWLQKIAARDGVAVETGATADGIAPRTAALMSALRREGENVLLLEPGAARQDAPDGDVAASPALVRDLGDAWWDDVDTQEISLAVLRGKHGGKETQLVERNLDVLASLGIPARLSVEDKRQK